MDLFTERSHRGSAKQARHLEGFALRCSSNTSSDSPLSSRSTVPLFSQLHSVGARPGHRTAGSLSSCSNFTRVPFVPPRSGELRTQKLKSHLARPKSLNVRPLKPGVGQYIAIRATLTARDFFLAYLYPSGPFICIFPKPLLISPFWLWLTHGSCVGPPNKIGHPAGCRFP